jgi:hypothetical protein
MPARRLKCYRFERVVVGSSLSAASLFSATLRWFLIDHSAESRSEPRPQPNSALAPGEPNVYRLRSQLLFGALAERNVPGGVRRTMHFRSAGAKKLIDRTSL